ncbi:uncharacterized protein LOC110612866 [Manihot esculenta]|nr:uncharacterized protein LOC110612866 [Manihot esculenta]
MASNVHHPKIEDSFHDEGSAEEDQDKYQEDLVKKYGEQFAESDGFEYDYWPVTMNWLGLGQRIHLEEDARYAEQVKEALDFAIRKQNEKGANLEVDKILIATGFLPFLYYITFRAKNLTTEETREYQTRVVWDPFTRSDADANVELFRFRKDKKRQSFMTSSVSSNRGDSFFIAAHILLCFCI